jgi:hypothetical protein
MRPITQKEIKPYIGGLYSYGNPMPVHLTQSVEDAFETSDQMQAFKMGYLVALNRIEKEGIELEQVLANQKRAARYLEKRIKAMMEWNRVTRKFDLPSTESEEYQKILNLLKGIE